jgi:hypothetical protein
MLQRMMNSEMARSGENHSDLILEKEKNATLKLKGSKTKKITGSLIEN